MENVHASKQVSRLSFSFFPRWAGLFIGIVGAFLVPYQAPLVASSPVSLGFIGSLLVIFAVVVLIGKQN